MANEITLRSNMDGIVSYNVKNGQAELTAEAALWKGGAALASLKDDALLIALTKAVNGKYRAASEILSVAFPSQARAFEKLYGVTPWANKQTMLSYIQAMENARPGKSGEWNKRQVAARTLMHALRNIPAFKAVPDDRVVIENAATETEQA